MYMEKTQDVPEYEIEGLMRTLKELGIKGIMENTDVIVLNHIIERGYIPHHREGIISSLKENTDMEYGEIMELINKWDRWKKYLPSYSLKLNQKLDIEGEHPAPFPEEIITLPILQTSKEFELVLDPFMGSGTTGRACDKLGRSFVGYDLKKY